MGRVKASIVLLLVYGLPLWAVPEARLIQQSKSGQTILLNLGSQDGIKEGDYAVLVKQIKPLESRDLRIIPAAKARNIKLNTDSSVWILYKIYDPELFIKGDKFLVLSESLLLKGRRDPRLGKITAIGEEGNLKTPAKDAVNEDPDRLSRLKDKYPDRETLHTETMMSDRDADLVDVNVWEKSKNTRYHRPLFKSPHKDEFRRQLRLETFEKMVSEYIKQVDDPDFNYDAFYEKQMRAAFSNEFKKKTNFDTEYENFLYTQSQKAVADAKLYRSILEKGDSWSEDFSDEELRIVLNEVSILQETDRRKFVVARPNRYSVSLDYARPFTDAQTDRDTSYKRDSRYVIDVNFEVVPFLKHPTLERFTLDGSFRTDKTAMETSGRNADLNERSFAVGANWYPLYSPYTIESAVIFLGAYARSGFANLRLPSTGENADYTALAVPGFRAGMKYLLRNNLGLRIVASMETLKLSQYKASRANPTLPSETTLVEGRIGFGLAYSF